MRFRPTGPGRFAAPALLLSLLLTAAAPGAAPAQMLTVDRVLVRAVETLARPELQADEVQRAVARGDWTPPDAPGRGPDGGDWRELVANEDGWIEDEALAEGVAYATVTVDEDGPWILESMGYAGVLVNGEPRVGNVYGYKDAYESWEPHFDYARIPVLLHRGANAFLFHGNRYGILRARLAPAAAPLSLNARDATLPDLVAGEDTDSFGAIVVMNATGDYVTDAKLRVQLSGDRAIDANVPVIPPYGVRKAGFPLRGRAIDAPGEAELRVTLRRGGRDLDTATLPLAVKDAHGNRRVTFVSDIDGSVQYYGFLPAARDDGAKALVLSLHGASVEAINQSGSYGAKEHTHILAPTNRRPFGFNWEGWGRLDALEVLALGMALPGVEPDRVYLTGHSMGGHGTWHVGVLHADRFAAIGPSAGWISFRSYRRDEPAPVDRLGEFVDRAMLPSRTRLLAPNLAGLGIYVLHGADDDNVPARQARLMLDTLATFHRDFTYHEEPDAGHWWDKSDEPGADCVDWAPMFDFFARHRRPSPDEVRHVAFGTPNLRVSARSRWVAIDRQIRPSVTSTIDVHVDPRARRVYGGTENVEAASFDLAAAGMTPGTPVRVELDGDAIDIPWPERGPLRVRWDGAWHAGPTPEPRLKGPRRAGPFREATLRRTQLVAATRGTPEENAAAFAQARRDAEFLWYQGNASVDVLPDSLYDPAAEPDRNVILYGNADTHADWGALWDGGDVTVARGLVRVGDRSFEGDGIGVLALRPRPGSDVAVVGIVAASGAPGMRLLHRRPYLSSSLSYPDLTVFRDRGGDAITAGAGFFDGAWSLARGETAWADDEDE